MSDIKCWRLTRSSVNTGTLNTRQALRVLCNEMRMTFYQWIYESMKHKCSFIFRANSVVINTNHLNYLVLFVHWENHTLDQMISLHCMVWLLEIFNTPKACRNFLLNSLMKSNQRDKIKAKHLRQITWMQISIPSVAHFIPANVERNRKKIWASLPVSIKFLSQ